MPHHADPRLDRTRWYPAAGAYLRAWKLGKQITQGGGMVALGWHGTLVNAAAFTREMWRALDRRINHKAALLDGTPEREPRTPEYLYQRDRHRLAPPGRSAPARSCVPIRDAGRTAAVRAPVE